MLYSSHHEMSPRHSQSIVPCETIFKVSITQSAIEKNFHSQVTKNSNINNDAVLSALGLLNNPFLSTALNALSAIDLAKDSLAIP